MSSIVEQAVSALQKLPADRRDELAQIIVEATKPSIRYSTEQLSGIDAAIAEADAGEFVSSKEITAVFSRFRKV